MTIYHFLVLAILFFGLPLIDKRKSNNKKIVFMVLSYTCMIAVIGFRGESVGEDTSAYMSMFRVIRETGWEDLIKCGLSFSWTRWGEDVEILFALLYKSISVFTEEAYVANCVVALISYILFARFIYKVIPEHVYFATLVLLCNGVFMSSFNAVRQVLALAILVNAYPLVEEKKHLRVLIISLTGFLIHFTSIILLPLFLVSRLKNKRRIVRLALISAVVFSVFTTLLASIVNRLLPVYAGYLKTATWNNTLGGTLLLWIVETICCIIIYYIGIDNNKELLGILGVVFSIAVNVIGMRVSIFSRLSVYFTFFNVLLFPCLIEKLPKYYKIVGSLVLFTLILFQYFSAASVPSRHYMFIWQ